MKIKGVEKALDLQNVGGSDFVAYAYLKHSLEFPEKLSEKLYWSFIIRMH